jgi:spermidine synthase
MPDLRDHPLPVVEETLSGKSLSFAGNEVQSAMRILEPDVLDLEYTRLMMGFLVFCPRPRRLLMVGLGGGSLAKFCYAYLPQTDITTVEINPHVIALRKDFAIPDDNARFRVLLGDAAQFVAQTPERFDVVVVDGFDALGVPPELSTLQFYADCRRVLAPTGVVVVNLHSCHPSFSRYVERLQAALGSSLTLVSDHEDSNCLCFACPEEGALQAHPLVARRPETMPPPAWAGICSSVARVFLAAKSVRRSASATIGVDCQFAGHQSLTSPTSTEVIST